MTGRPAGDSGQPTTTAGARLRAQLLTAAAWRPSFRARRGTGQHATGGLPPMRPDQRAAKARRQ